MKLLAISALICALAAQLAHGAPSEKVDCSKFDQVIDDLGIKQAFTTLSDEYKLQTTLEAHQKRCDEMMDALKTLKKYNKECLSSLTQQVLGAVLRTRVQATEERCKDPNSDLFKGTLEAAKCVAENSLEQVRTAEKEAVLMLQTLYDANVPDDKLRIRRSCCSVLEAKKLFLGATKEKCEKHQTHFTVYYDSYTSEAMGLICPEADKLDCDKLEKIKTEGVAMKSKFLLQPMVKLVKSIDH